MDGLVENTKKHLNGGIKGNSGKGYRAPSFKEMLEKLEDKLALPGIIKCRQRDTSDVVALESVLDVVNIY